MGSFKDGLERRVSSLLDRFNGGGLQKVLEKIKPKPGGKLDNFPKPGGKLDNFIMSKYCLPSWFIATAAIAAYIIFGGGNTNPTKPEDPYKDKSASELVEDVNALAGVHHYFDAHMTWIADSTLFGIRDYSQPPHTQNLDQLKLIATSSPNFMRTENDSGESYSPRFGSPPFSISHKFGGGNCEAGDASSAAMLHDDSASYDIASMHISNDSTETSGHKICLLRDRETGKYGSSGMGRSDRLPAVFDSPDDIFEAVNNQLQIPKAEFELFGYDKSTLIHGYSALDKYICGEVDSSITQLAIEHPFKPDTFYVFPIKAIPHELRSPVLGTRMLALESGTATSSSELNCYEFSNGGICIRYDTRFIFKNEPLAPVVRYLPFSQPN